MLLLKLGPLKKFKLLYSIFNRNLLLFLTFVFFYLLLIFYNDEPNAVVLNRRLENLNFK